MPASLPFGQWKLCKTAVTVATGGGGGGGGEEDVDPVPTFVSGPIL